MAFASAPRPARLSDIHNQSVEPANSPGSGAIGCAVGCRGEIAAHELDDAEVVAVAVNRGIDLAASRQVGERSIELTDRQVPVATPSQQQRVVRLDLEPVREGGNGFAELPGTRFSDPDVDEF